MANNIITFPQYLNQPAFQYRKVTIRVIRANDKTSDMITNFEDVINKATSATSDLLSSAVSGISDSISGAESGGDLLTKANQKLEQIGKKMRGNTQTLYTFTLPLPNSFTDSHSHQWSVDKGIVGEVFQGVEQTNAGKVLAMMYDSANQRKPLADPGYFQNYSGTEPREFSLSFDLVPNNAQEAADIFNIIYIMRNYALPSTGLSHALVLAPHYFQLELSNNHMNALVNATDVVLKSVSVDYGADGNMQQYADGTPKQIKMDLVFAERSMSTNVLDKI